MINIEQLININYIKYDTMMKLVSGAFSGSDAINVDIYIDMHSLIKPLYSNNNYSINDYSAITSCIINMCAHYRAYFQNRHRVNTRFFIVYSNNCSEINKKFYYKYNIKTEEMIRANAMVTDMVNQNLELLEILCPYLPDIFFVKGTFETSVIMTELITKYSIKNTPAIVITKDQYNYQLVNINSTDVVIFRPKKYNGEDLSYYIDRSCLFSTYILENCNQKNIEYDYSDLNPNLLSLLMTLNKVPSRSIKSLYNISKSASIIRYAIQNHLILNDYNSDTQFIWNNLYSNIPNFISYSEFDTRFRSIDLQFQYNLFINHIESSFIVLLDLYDPKTVMSINDKYFKSNPLDLGRL